MLTLAFDTSGFAGSVALLEDELVLAEHVLDPARRSAQTLVPAMVELLERTGRHPADVRLVATTLGPGSFTGLRVGVTAAKAFAYAIGAEVMGLSTLEAVVHQVPAADLPATGCEIHAVQDAQRKELFVGVWIAEQGTGKLPALQRLEPDRIVPAHEWLVRLRPGTVVTGSGLRGLLDRLPTGVIAVHPSHWEPLAATVGQLAWREHRRGRRDDLWKLAPTYLRGSAAEEKAALAARQAPPSTPPPA